MSPVSHSTPEVTSFTKASLAEVGVCWAFPVTKVTEYGEIADIETLVNAPTGTSQMLQSISNMRGSWVYEWWIFGRCPLKGILVLVGTCYWNNCMGWALLSQNKQALSLKEDTAVFHEEAQSTSSTRQQHINSKSVYCYAYINLYIYIYVHYIHHYQLMYKFASNIVFVGLFASL